MNTYKSNQRVKWTKSLYKSLSGFCWIPCYTWEESAWGTSVYNLYLQWEKKEIANETKEQPSESATRNNSCLKHWFSKRQGICEEPTACVSEDVEVNWRCDFLVPKQW